MKLVTFFLHCSPPPLFLSLCAVGLFVTDLPVLPVYHCAWLKTVRIEVCHSPLEVRDILFAADPIVFPVGVLPGIWRRRLAIEFAESILHQKPSAQSFKCCFIQCVHEGSAFAIFVGNHPVFLIRNPVRLLEINKLRCLLLPQPTLKGVGDFSRRSNPPPSGGGEVTSNASFFPSLLSRA